MSAHITPSKQINQGLDDDRQSLIQRPHSLPWAAGTFALNVLLALASSLSLMVFPEGVLAQTRLTATAIESADRLFSTDTRWRGCGRAVSIALRDGRILWLFSESAIEAGGNAGTAVLHNSVALQIGGNPATAELVHFWDRTQRLPGPFFKDGRGFWYWPIDGLEVGASLLVLLFKVRPAIRDEAPEVVEWSIVRVVNPQESPARWQFQKIPTPANQFGAVIGFGGFLQIGAYILTAARLPDRHGEVFLVRWPLNRIVRNDFTTPEWWTSRGGWASQESLDEEPDAVASDVDGEFALHWNSTLDRAFLFESRKDDPEAVQVYESPDPTGPWTEPANLLSVDGGDVLDNVTVSLSRGLQGTQLVLSLVPSSSGSGKSSSPQLFSISPR